MKKGMYAALVCLAVLLLCAGCGAEQLELSEEQLETVVNYSAAILNKHNSNYKSSLQNFNDESLARLMAEEARRKMREEERKKQMEDAKKARLENENGGGKDGGKDGEGGADGEKQPPSLLDASAEEISNLAETLGIEGFDISYEDFSVSDTYPEASEQDSGVFGINAASGDKLLILKFRITNTSSEAGECSILDTNTVFRIKINGENHSVLSTLLLDDFATFEETMEPGESAEAVLIAEISSEKAENINTLVLILKGSPLREMILLDNGEGSAAVSSSEEAPEESEAPPEEASESEEGAGVSEEGEESGDTAPEGTENPPGEEEAPAEAGEQAEDNG